MQLLALDLATHLGWACGDAEAGEPVSGHYKLPLTGEDIGAFLMAYDQWLRPVLAEHEPKLVVFEAPMLGRSGMTQLATLLKLYGLCSHTELICKYKRIEVRQVHSGAWKKGFVGKGNFGKNDKPYPVIGACLERGWKVTNDNEADALGIWTYSVRFASPGREARFDPLARKGLLSTAA